MRVDLSQAMFSLSYALDLVGVTEVRHGKRVAYMAGEMAKAMGWSSAALDRVVMAGLLHDCGVSRTGERTQLVAHMEWEEAGGHCQRGYDYLSECSPFAAVAEPVLYHHTYWKHLQTIDVDPGVSVTANTIFLADRVDFLQGNIRDKHILVARNALVDQIARLRGTHFSPELVDGFVAVAGRDAFWLAMDDNYVDQFVGDLVPARSWGSGAHMLDDVRSIARLLAHIVDAKSRFTAEHSVRVAAVARALAVRIGLPLAACDEIELAGLLHDIGKLRVPDEILDKPGSLTEDERAVIGQHGFDTYQILRNIFFDSKIAEWAAFHHERPSGNGGPFGRQGKNLSTEARIIAVADVWQAVLQDRPYRARMTQDDAIEILRSLALRNDLDPGIVGVVEVCAEEFYDIAVGPPGTEPGRGIP